MSKDVVKESGDGSPVPYPKSVIFILSTEACERFSYYGMRTILAIYLKDLFFREAVSSGKEPDLDAIEDDATLYYHLFVFLSYFFCLVGAFLSDSFLGKFKTIFYISIIYAIGQIILSAGAIPDTQQGIEGMPQVILSFVGLLLIAFGTGGIKPCVVAFGADQFKLPEQEVQLASFFGIFYASINFGSLISTLLTPTLRRTECLGGPCFSLAFGVPAILMIVAIISFVIGRPGYKVAIPETNVVSNFVGCIWSGLKGKLSSSEGKRDHWLDNAEDKYGADFVLDVKSVIRVCGIFLLYPLFWALFDQQGSRWTFQATRMNGSIGPVTILPDQMQVVNALFILVFIPIFDKIIYPLGAKVGALKTPLQRIITGMAIMAIAFAVSGFIEMQLEQTYPYPPGQVDEKSFTSRLAVYNGLENECSFDLTFKGLDVDKLEASVKGQETYVFENEDGRELLPFLLKENTTAVMSATCKDDNKRLQNEEFTIVPGESRTLMLSSESASTDLYLYRPKSMDAVQKSSSGGALLKLVYHKLDEKWNGAVVTVRPEGKEKVRAEYIVVLDNEGYGDSESVVLGESGDLLPLSNSKSTMCVTKEKLEWCGNLELFIGGSYTAYLSMSEEEEEELELNLQIVTPANSMHMMWLLPQYLILTAGEVLFSITSLSFAFTEAPSSMKAVVQALFLLTTATGNLINMIIVGAFSGLFESQVYEFFLFSGLMLLNVGALILVAMRYSYVQRE